MYVIKLARVILMKTWKVKAISSFYLLKKSFEYFSINVVLKLQLFKVILAQILSKFKYLCFSSELELDTLCAAVKQSNNIERRQNRIS